MIGMFLPVFLVGDFGWPGFLAFAIPNCAGAMAVGLVLRSGGALGVLRTHGVAVLAFSIVTALFHVYFLSAMSSWIAPAGWRWAMPMAAAGLCVVAAGLGLMRTSRWHRLALGAFVASVACGVLAWWSTGGAAYAAPAAAGAFAPERLMFVVPALCFGFLLCPFLDVSFLRTRQEQEGRAGTRAFVLSFALFFPAMIVFTLLYAQAFNGLAVVSLWFCAHIAVQSVFTMGVHLREWPGIVAGGSAHFGDGARFHRVGLWMFRASWVAAAALIAGGALIAERGYFRFGYELFMSCYGLVFPAYVWIVMVPRRGSEGMRARVMGWGAACVLAGPFFWFGYVEQRWAVLPVGVLIPLVMPWVVGVLGAGGRSGRGSSEGVDS